MVFTAKENIQSRNGNLIGTALDRAVEVKDLVMASKTVFEKQILTVYVTIIIKQLEFEYSNIHNFNAQFTMKHEQTKGTAI